MEELVIIKLNLRNNFLHSYTYKILVEAYNLFLQLWPYIVIGIILTALIRIYISKGTISKILVKNNFFSILIASLIGVVSPLGSYVIIPLSVSLLSVGVPLAVTMALIVSSPIINPNLFILTAGALGYHVAFARIAAAFILGISAGYITLLLSKHTAKNVLLTGIKEELELSTVNVTGKNGRMPPKYFLLKFYREALKMTKWVGRFFFLAIVIAAAVKILTPPKLIIKLFGQNEFMSVLISTGAGLPFYSCGGAAIPIVQELSDMGMNKGAVLAFFISGPVTKISNLVVLRSVYNNIVLSIYLATGILGAILLGFLFNCI